MSKPKAQRRVSDDAAIARSKVIRTSARKLNIVAASIRGKRASDAVVALEFTPRRIAGEVKKVLQAAIANAENNHQLDVDRLYVAEASVGRSFVMKRWHARGRGKSSGVEKPFSNLTVIVKEKVEETKAAKVSAKKTEVKATKAKSEPKAKQQEADA